jgi:hypothetical protein
VIEKCESSNKYKRILALGVCDCRSIAGDEEEESGLAEKWGLRIGATARLRDLGSA